MEVPGRLITALHDHSGAVADTGVAGSAVDVVSLLAPSHNLHGDRERQHVRFLALDQAGVEETIFVQLAARYGVRNLGPNRAAIREKRGAALGNELGLILHILATAGCYARHGGQAQNQKPGKRPRWGYRINTPPPPPRPAQSFPERHVTLPHQI